MNKYTFTKEKDPDNEFDKTHIEFSVDTESRGDLLDEFKCFLLACGFSVNGTLEIVEE